MPLFPFYIRTQNTMALYVVQDGVEQRRAWAARQNLHTHTHTHVTRYTLHVTLTHRTFTRFRRSSEYLMIVSPVSRRVGCDPNKRNIFYVISISHASLCTYWRILLSLEENDLCVLTLRCMEQWQQARRLHKDHQSDDKS